jgi:hypothetical protein
MRRVSLTLSLVVFMLALLIGMSSMGAVAAQGETPETLQQEATPQVGGLTFPLEADPALCTVEPRDTDELLDVWFPTEGTPAATVAAVVEESPTEVTIPLGQPADDEEISAIYATVHEVFSCFEAGDFGRALALFTDDLALQFTPDPGQSREDVTAFLEATPIPEEGGGESQIIAITDVMVLEDGRIGAFVVDRGPQGDATAYAIFEQEQDGDRWLVDEVIGFSSGEE